MAFTGPNVWTSTHPTLQDGLAYQVRMRATDKAGNVEPLRATTAFTFDVSSPTAGIVLPVNNSNISSLPTISGTVTDNTGLSGVQQVELAIYVDTGGWYNEANNTFDQSSEHYFVTSSTNGFATWFSTGIPFVSGHIYALRSRATDKANNVQTIFATAVSTLSFTFDNTAPASQVTFPDGTQVRSTIPQILGTASDNKSGVAYVYASVGQISGATTNYFDGTGFTAATEYFNLATGTTSWSYNASIPYTSGLRYLFRSFAIDQSGNIETALVPQIAAWYDVTKPTTSLTSPLSSTYRSELDSIQGNAFDATAGLAALASNGVQVRILELGGNWWGGSSFNQPDPNAAWSNATGGTPTSWTYVNGSLTSALQSGTTYLIQVRAKDTAVPANQGPSSNGTNSNFTLGVDSNTVVIDKVAPVSGIFLPASGGTTWYYNSLPTISGTSTDAISRITSAAQVTVSIKEALPAGAWWSGASTFTASSEQFFGATTLAAANSTWTLTMPTLRHGMAYLIRVKASDNVVPTPNSETALSSTTFVYDVQYPTATVYSPANGAIISALTDISGTTQEEFVTSAVYITVRDDTMNLWWDNTNSTFTLLNGAKVFYLASQVAGSWNNWTWSFPSSKFVTGRDYTINVYATDAAGNTQPVAISGFTWDKTDPLSEVTVPTNGSFLRVGAFTTVSGTADDANDIQTVEVSIQRLSDSNWWNSGSNSWSGSGPLYISQTATLDGAAGSHPRGWHLTSGLPADAKLSADGLYRVRVRATDAPGNIQQTISNGITFRYDVDAPSLAIQYPVDSTIYPSITSIYGTAQDNFNTKRVELRLKNGNNEYWDGGSWVAPVNTWVVATGTSASFNTVNWTYTTVPTWAAQTYQLNVRAVDEAGNYTQNYSSITFTFDNIPPVTITTYPVSGSTYRSVAFINGTVQDGLSPRDILETRVKIYRSTGVGGVEHWNGGSDAWEGPEVWNLVNRTSHGGSLYYWDYSDTNFTDPNPALTWTSGTTYYIVSRAIDTAGNVAVESSTKTFVFDNTPPASAPTNPLDARAYKASDLAIISGTAIDATSAIASVQLSIKDEDTAGGAKYFNGSTFSATTETFLDVAQLFSASWTYTSGGLSFNNGHHYVFKSSAADIIGNVETPGSGNRILLDGQNPVSGVVSPTNDFTGTPSQTVFGTASDPGFTSGISGTGSGVKSTLSWHQGKAQLLILRDEGVSIGAGPVTYGSWNIAEDFVWNGSTWVAASNTPTWVDADSMDGLGNWTYLGLVNNWVKGKFYVAWVRAIDNAGNVQNAITPGPKFQIAAPAASFVVTGLTDSQAAGFDHTITVEARDAQGFRATGYQGTVVFSAPGGPETSDTDDTLDDIYGLPKSYTFVSGDAGIHTFTTSVRFRQSGTRQIRAEDSVDASIFGVQSGITVNPASAIGLLVVAAGQTYAPGESPTPDGDGKTGSITPVTAGNTIVSQIKVVDKYWNTVTSSSPVISVVTSDPYDTDPGSVSITAGTATVNVTMTTAGNQTITASGAGTDGISNTVVINPKSADRLVAVLPGQTRTQGKYNVIPFGKTGSVSNIYAGQAMTVSVYGVDQYYNLDPAASVVVYTDLPNDSYDTTPFSRTLVSGTTAFTLTPVTSGSQVVRSTANVTNNTYTSESFTVLADTDSTQIRIQLVFSGETPVPGLPPYAQQNGGKNGTPNAQYAGLGSTVTVRLVDRFYNLITGGAVMPTVTLTTSDPNDDGFGFAPVAVSLVNGVKQATITFVTSNNAYSSSANPARNNKGWQVTTNGGGLYTADVSTWVVTYPNDIVKLRLLASNQVIQEGSSPSGSGKTNSGSPVSGTAGTAYPLTVQAVDQYWNQNLGLGPLHNTGAGQNVDIESNDPYSLFHSTGPLTQGEKVFSTFEPRTAQTLTVYAYSVDDPLISSQTITGITITPAAAAHYQTLLPGETPLPGSNVYPTGGKSGTPNTQTAGTAIPSPGVEIRLVDDYWNPIVSGPLPWVILTAPETVDTYAVLPSSQQMALSGGVYRAVFTSTVTLRTAGAALSHRILATDPGLTNYSASYSSYFTVQPNTLNRLQVLMPGETADPGRPANWLGGGGLAGKTGSPDEDGISANGVQSFYAGNSYNVTVNGVDAFYNVVSTNSTISLTSSDLNGTPDNVTPLSNTLAAGTTGFSVIFKTAQDAAAAPVTQQLTAASGALTPGLTPNLNIQANSSTHIQVLLTGETAAPGTSAGKTGTPTAAIAGEDYSIVTRLTDDYWNAIGNTSSDVGLRLTTTDPYDSPDPDTTATILQGAGNFSTTYTHKFQRQNTTGWYVTASTQTGPLYVSTMVGPVPVTADSNAANNHYLIVVLPGEQFEAGKTAAPAGRTGTPDFTAVLGSSVPRAGDSFPVTVVAVDRFYNKVDDSDNPLVTISANPFLFPTYAPGASFTLTNGSATVNVTLRRSTGTATLSINEAAYGSGIEYSTGTSSTFSVVPNSATRLQVLLPGETAVPGSSTGKTGSADSDGNNSANGDGIAGNIDDFVAGVPYQVNVRATDDYYNLVTGATPKVTLTLTDPYAQPASQQQDLISGSTVYAVTFFTANPSGWNINVATSAGINLIPATSANAIVRANSATKLLVLVPGQTQVPGNVSASGKSGTITGATAGSVWIATVTAVDNWYNTVTSASGNAWFVTSDPYDVEATTRTLVNGTTSFSIQMVQAGNQTLTVYHLEGFYSTGTVTNIPITAGTANRALVILPGETYLPGKPPYTIGSGTGGKATPDSPSSQTAGTAINPVTVYATDAYWNQAVSVATVTLTAPADVNPMGLTDLHLVGGATSYAPILYKAVDYNGSTHTFSVSIAGLTNPDYDTPQFILYPDTVGPRKIRMLYPGESRVPGTVAGKSGTVTGPAADSHFTAGQLVAITLDGTDSWGNILDVGSTFTYTTDDAYDTNDPRSVTLLHGTSSYMHRFITERTNDAGEVTIPNFTYATATASGYAPQSVAINVDDDDTVRNLQILVQGETPVPGSGTWPTAGKSGQPDGNTGTGPIDNFAAGQNISITVRVVDNYWNLVENPQKGQPLIQLTATDPNVSVPLLSGAPMSGGALSTTVQLRTKNLTPGWVITATGTANTFGFANNTSAAIPVDAGALAALQILAPGETPSSGTITGKLGTPSTQVAGTLFNIPIGNIRAIDAFYNTVSTNGSVTVTMRDPFGLPQSQTLALSAGANPAVVPITLKISTATFSPQELYVNGLGVVGSTSTAIPVNPNTATKLQVLLPGETAVPGSASGKIGTPSGAAAGDNYAVSVNLTDNYFNTVPQATQPTVRLLTMEPTSFFTVAPAQQTLAINGSASYTMTFQGANSAPGWRVLATTVPASVYSALPDTSPVVVVVATTTDRLQLVLPGETAVPGSTVGNARGLSGTPTAATAGVDYIVTVRLTDRFYNLKTDATPQVQVDTNDPYDTHPSTRTMLNGTTTYTIQFHTAPGPYWIHAATVPSHVTPTLADFTSANVAVNPGSPTMLQVLLPGESAVPGKPPYDFGENGGKTGTPDFDGNNGNGIQSFVAGSTFDVTVNLVDQYFNRSNTQNTFVVLSANDPYDTLAALGQKQTGAGGYQNGQTAFLGASLVTRNTTPGWQIFASTNNGDNYSMGRSTWVPVASGSLQQLLVLAPGEVSEEGNPIGKSNPNPSTEVAGTTFTVTVRAVDSNYNIVTTTDSLVALTFIGNSDATKDDAFSEPTRPLAKNLISGTTTFDLYLVTAENKQTIIIATAPALTPGYSGSIPMTADVTDRFQILLPGETAVPGSYASGARGLTGQPDIDGNNANGISPFIAGTPFNVQIRATDRFWNKTTATPINMTLTSSDLNDLSDPMTINLTAGATTVAWTFNTSNQTPGWNLTVDDGVAAFTGFTSTDVPTAPGTATKLQILLPGETAAPGTSTGKTGTPYAWVAGVSSKVIVNVVDSNWNIVPTASLSVRLSNNTDVYTSTQTLPLTNGTTTFNFTMYTATAATTFTAQRTSGLSIANPTSTSASFATNANSATQLQVLVPGQTALPGKPPYNGTGGYSGSPDYDSNSGNGVTAFPAGVPFNVTVRAVDNYYNLVQPSAKVQLMTEDPFDPTINPQSLAAGTTTFSIYMQTVNQAPGWTITVATTSDSPTSLIANTTPAIPVTAGAAAKLQLLLPGETAVPGSTANSTLGKTGTPTNATAGTRYDVVVRLTDAFYNVITGGAMPTVGLTTTDPYDDETTFFGGNPQSLDPFTGSATIGVFFNTSSSWTVTATDDPYTNLYQNDTSTTVFVQPAAPTRLLVIMPGETHTPGKVTAPQGKTGTPITQTAGENVPATVLIVDNYYNLVSTAQNPISITTDDPYDTDPGNYSVTGGSLTISNLSFRVAYRSAVVTATDSDSAGPSLVAGNSASVPVLPSTATRLQLVLPGETAQPGNTALVRGVTGTPTATQSGVNIPVQVRLTDSFWNLTQSTSAVRLTSADPFDGTSGPWPSAGKDPYDFVVVQGSGTFNFPLITISTTGWALTATDTDDNTSPYPIRFTSFVSSTIVVNPGPPAKLITVLPGESVASGSLTGKTGVASTATAGVEIDVKVYVADAFNNVVTVPPATAGTNSADVRIKVANNTDPNVIINTSTQAISPVTGLTIFQMTLVKASTHSIQADDISVNHSAWTTSVSSTFTVVPNTATRLLTLMPGETALPGTGAPGKTGTPTAQVAGASFPVIVQIVDDYYNQQPSHPAENLRVDTSDLYDTHPGTATYADGTSSDIFAVTLRTKGASHTLAAYDTNMLMPGTTWTYSQSGTFTVNASSASRFLVLLPGESQVEGSLTGKSGAISTVTAGVSFALTVLVTDEQFNTVTNSTAPHVLLHSNDVLEEYVSANPNDVLNGSRGYTMKAKTATTNFSVTASTTTGTPVGTERIVDGTASGMRVWPAGANHFEFANLPSSPIAAGDPFNGTIRVRDQFQNIISTGPNLYTGTVVFQAETSTDPAQVAVLPPNFTFSASDAGIKDFIGGPEGNFTLKKAGSRWLKAYDFGDSNISTERSGYSSRPYITVLPGVANKFLILSPLDISDGVTDSKVSVPAGNISNLGKTQLVGQLSDQFNNYISTPNFGVDLSAINVTGSTGTFKYQSGVSYTTITSTWTDANGQIGANPAFYYFVSTKAADKAQIRLSSGSIIGDSLQIVTVGGSPSKLVFVNPPASSQVGQWTANQFTLERRDDFDNATSQSVSNVTLGLGTGQDTTHSNDSKTFYFTQPLDQASHINTMVFNIGVSQLKFSFYDTMSSLPIGEDGRLGTWQIRADGPPLTAAVYELPVNAGPTATIGVDNAKHSVEAGKTTYQGVVQEFQFELWDSFANPTLATETIKIIFTSTRSASATNDAFGFVTSSSVVSLPGLTALTTGTIDIASGTYVSNFYYFDTRSSESYGILSSSRPVIGGYAAQRSWQTADHFVDIQPTFDFQNKVVILSSPAVFVAGGTSTVRQIQLQDKYSNPTPVILGSEDSNGNGIQFKLQSDSAGNYGFASPSTATFSTGDGLAQLMLGQHTTTYYLRDTKSGNHLHTVRENLSPSRGWAIDTQTYTVVAAPPYKILFVTPVRKLIAGTTNTYAVGVSTPNIQIQMQDVYDNVAISTYSQVIDIFSNSSLGKASVSPNGTFASIFGANALSLTFSAGISERDFFYEDDTTGFPVLSAVHQQNLLRSTTQQVIITPNRATKLSLEHNFSFTSPLSVRNEGIINVVARDQFNNVADGGASMGENNGYLYSGTIMLSQSASTTSVTLSGDGVGISTLTLTASATGTFTVKDLIQETLRLYATDYARPSVYGQTNLAPSNSDITTTGLVGTPVDMAPEPIGARSPFKDAIFVPIALAQGDGTTADKPNPVPMLRIRAEVKPTGINTYAVWKALRVTKLGSIPNQDVIEVALWRDMGFKDGEFDPTDDGNGVTVGVPLATGTFQNVSGNDICDLDFTASSQTVTTIFQQYFITVRISTTATENTTLGVGVLDSSAFTIPAAESTARIAENNFPMLSYKSDIIKTPAPVMMKVTDIAAYYSNQKSSSVPQGLPAAGYLKVAVWTRNFTGVLDKIRVTRIGTASDLDVTDVRMYMDGLDGTNGDGFFQPAGDTLINSSVVSFSTSAATLDIQPNLLVDGTTKYMFIVMGVAESAQIGATLGVRIPSRTDVILTDGLMVDFNQDPTMQSFPVLSGTPPIAATNDHLVINPVPIAPAAAIQGDKDVGLLRLDMNASDHSVILTGIRINRKNANLVNKADDVSDIRIYYDIDGDRVFNASVDKIVSSTSKAVKFNSTTLTSPISNSATNIPVQSVEDFPVAPGRLVIEDNSGNREVVTYAGIDAVFNEFTGVTRGVEGSTPIAHASNVQLDGQASIPVFGPFNGQEILGNLKFKPETLLAADLDASTGPITISIADTTEFPASGAFQIGSELGLTYTGKTATTLTGVRRTAAVSHITGESVFGAARNKSFFVAYDIADLATPGRLAGAQTVLGLDIPATSYISVGAPDVVDPVPSFNAEIGDIFEYGDSITVTSTNTSTGNTLQQQSVNQPILQMMMATNKAEAYWTNLVVTATGTANPADVKRVSVWRDADNNGVFTTQNDVLIGSGTFGNTGNPKLASIAYVAQQKLVTNSRSLAQGITQRYFVTVDMESLATPETTFGLVLAGPSSFSMVPTPPNLDTVANTNLPFASKLRTVIPSPRVVTIQPTMLHSNSLGVSATPVVDVDITASATAIPIRPNTLGLPTSGYAVIDSEVVFYATKSNGALQSVSRAQLGTVANAHLGGSQLGVYYTQGDLNNAYMKLLVSCNGFNVRWFSLKLNRYLPAGSIKGDDQDVTMIHVWKDNGNGILDRDPSTGQIPPGTEVLVGEKALGTNGDAGGTASIALNDPTAGSPGFALVTSQQTTYWITVDVNPTALFDDLLGFKIQAPASFTIGALTANDGIHSVSTTSIPITSAASVIRPTIDTMKIFIEDLAPPQVTQNKKFVPIARINLKTDANTAVWQKLRVDLTTDNGAVSGDVSAIRLFKDVGNDTIFNVQETSTDVNGKLINMLSQGTETFNDKVTTLILNPQVIESETVNPAGQNYFLAYDINAFAQVGVNVGAQIATTDYFTIAYPDVETFNAVTPPFLSSRSNIVAVSNQITLSVDDNAKQVANTGGTYQASQNVEVMRFTLTTDISQAYWNAIRIERNGSSPTQGFQYGHNEDVKYVKIWRDVNFNDQLDAGDELLSAPTIQFDLTDENNRIVQIPLTKPVLLSPTARSFFLSYDIGEGAEAGAAVGAKIGDTAWISVSQPNQVSPTIKFLTASATNQSYPYETSLIPINAVLVDVAGQTLSPAQIPQLSTGVPMMMLSMKTDRNFVTLKKIKFYQTGTIETSVDGQGDIKQISIWRDNGNTIFEPYADTLIGSVLHAASTNYANGIAVIDLDGTAGEVITTDPTNFFVTIDVGDRSLSGKSTRGHSFGLKIKTFGDFTFVPPTAGASTDINYVSLITNLTTILDEGAMIVSPVFLLPKIWANPYGDGYPALDENGSPEPRRYDSDGVPMVDVDDDGANDIIKDAATALPGVDLDGDGLIEVDMTRSGFLSVDFNNDGIPDDVLPDQNGDGIPEIDLGKDGFADFGYIPEKWSKETSRLFSRWAKIKSGALDRYEIGLGVNNLTNSVSEAQGNNGWVTSDKENSLELNNLTLLSAAVARLSQSIPLDKNPPFDLLVDNTSDLTNFTGENGQIQVDSEIMSYSVRANNVFHVNKRGESFGTPRVEHLLAARVTNEAYVVRARAVSTSGVAGAETAIKVYRVDLSPPSIPGKPVSDQELAGGAPAKTGVFTIKWSGSSDSESGVRAYEIQERVDNDPVWATIRMVPSAQHSLLVGNKDNPSNLPKPSGHFYSYRVRALNQAGGVSDWSAPSAAASTGFPTEAITKVTNYPNPVDIRQGPTNISYILNEDSSVKITLFDILGYQIRSWEFSAGGNGGKAGPNVFKWDGTDAGGSKVAAGGYIMRIEVIGTKGSTTVIRKIGILN